MSSVEVGLQVAARGLELLEVEELGEWAAEWDRLVERAPVPSPFLRSWWLAAVGGPAARYLLVIDDGRLAGGLALERRRVLGVAVYRMCGSGPLCPDHLDALAAAGRAGAVCAALAEWLRRPGARLLDLTGVVEDSLAARAFPHARRTVVDVAPWDVLPDSGAAYLAGRSAGMRKLHRQAGARLAALGCRPEPVPADEADAVLDEFERLHRARGNRTALLAQLPRLRPALRAGAALGEVQLDAVRCAGRTVAVAVSFRVGGVLRAYQIAREVDGELADAGTLLLLSVVQRACDEGCREVDLLRGHEPYKSRFVSQRRRLYRLQVAHGRRARALLAGARGLRRLRRRAGRLRRAVRHALRRSAAREVP